ncbi:MAG: hypothetical protein NTZ85_02380, partial [Bacteroidia bacterium]|nr:hypothetical protein [Bacteroidia bacterium]
MFKRLSFLAMIVMIAFAIPALAGTNVGNVNQTGDLNVATIDQVGSSDVANITQYGTNRADIDQTGNSNQATIVQGAPGNHVYNLYEPSYHPAGDWAMGAYIKQNGNSNTASIIERASDTYAHIYQTGNRNIGSQDIGTYESKANYITFSPHRGVLIDQIGSDNQAYQTTVASFGCYGIDNMQILQQGNWNYANQYSQGGMASVMEIFQTGNSNNSVQYQDGRFSRAHAGITGSSNITNQYQLYTVWSVSGVNSA